MGTQFTSMHDQKSSIIKKQPKNMQNSVRSSRMSGEYDQHVNTNVIKHNTLTTITQDSNQNRTSTIIGYSNRNSSHNMLNPESQLLYQSINNSQKQKHKQINNYKIKSSPITKKIPTFSSPLSYNSNSSIHIQKDINNHNNNNNYIQQMYEMQQQSQQQIQKQKQKYDDVNVNVSKNGVKQCQSVMESSVSVIENIDMRQIEQKQEQEQENETFSKLLNIKKLSSQAQRYRYKTINSPNKNIQPHNKIKYNQNNDIFNISIIQHLDSITHHKNNNIKQQQKINNTMVHLSARINRPNNLLYF